MQIPVYIFTGFLESGKTTFIQDTLEDKRFNAGERTLLLLCEEGEEEFDSSKFSSKNVFIEVIDDKEELNEKNLENMIKKHKAERVVVEYNGIWLIQDFYDNMPENWMPAQSMLFFDSNTFLSYNSNMRSLVVDKLQDAEVIVFNRIEVGTDTMEYHKIVRGISRRADILYEYKDGTLIPDEIEDPLPFDINAPVIEIEDKDYALFYRDLTEEMKKYKEKVVKFTAVAAVDPKFPDKTCVLGRHIMTCCADDITYCGFVSKLGDIKVPENYQWFKVTAKIDIRFSRLYAKKGPVFYVQELLPVSAPEQQVATFY